MREAASILLCYLAVALLHAAKASRFPYPVPGKTSRAWGPGLRVAALGAAALSARLWAATEDATAGLLVTSSALMLSASLFVLVAPLAPRLAWGAAAACPLLIALLAIAGAHHGG